MSQSREAKNAVRRALYASSAEHRAKQKAYMVAYYQEHKADWNVNQKQGVDRKRNPAKDRESHLQRHYGISTAEYLRLLDDQDGRCAVCRTNDAANLRSQYFCVDHDHKTGKVRGLLCTNCNLALGYLRDDMDLVMAAAGYLIQHENLLVLTEGMV